MEKGTKTALMVIGIVLLVIGVIGIAYNYYTTWMWILAIVGVIGILWGWLGKGKMMGPQM